MKKTLLSLFAILCFTLIFGQKDNLWTPAKNLNNKEIKVNKRAISTPTLFNLDVDKLKQIISESPRKTTKLSKSAVTVSFPVSESEFQNFSIYKTSNFSPELEAAHPEIATYYGESIDGKSAKIYFSLSPLGLSSMQLRLGKEAVFVEPYDNNNSTYVVYKKSDKGSSKNKFECATSAKSSTDGLKMGKILSADDGLLRTYRLALSCTGEYTQYFGGTKALALAAMNNTMTRVNGVFENDFAIRLVLIPEQENIIFTSASTDPYSNATAGADGAWNTELMNVLHGTTYGIGDSKFDIGHLFGASGGGGNAGCIGCVCNNSTTYDATEQWYWYKGQGYTSPADDVPSGDSFDIDYVAHEIGHQFGGNHTFTDSEEYTIAQVEPGSGSTIMGYAGITTEDVQAHSDPYFHAVSIQQITEYVKSTSGSCSVNTPTGNNAPTANAGADFTIPKSTPFMLTGSASDSNGDALTYTWEQMDVQNSTVSDPSATKTTGPAFRSYSPTTSPVRYFPKMSSVLNGATTTAGLELNVEVLPSVSRTLKFRFTARDNKANGAGNAYDDMMVTVSSTAGPLIITSQNAAGISYPQGSSQNVTWNVANTNTLAANVDILLSTDSGNTWSTLITGTPNDGSQSVTIPSVTSNTCRFMVKASGNIFFNVNTANFSITAPDTENPTAPTLSANNTTSTKTTLSWTGATDNVAVASYDIYKDGTLVANSTTSPYTVTGLSASTSYVFTVKAKDASNNISVSSNAVTVTTLAPDTEAPTAPSLSASGTTNVSTTLTFTGATDNIGVTAYEIYKDGALIANVNNSPYTVTGLSASTTYIFTVKAKDDAGNVSPLSNAVSVTTLAAPAATELYISEYYEGTSNNKVLEITNPTLSAISLSSYSIKKQADGSGAWNNELKLTGTINPKSTLVLKNTSTSLPCSFTAQSVGSAPIDFNGNDPVGLFKNSTLIDVVGTFNSSSNFAKDTDLRRNVIIPNPVYTPSEWDVLAITTTVPNCDNLGIANPASALGVKDTTLNPTDVVILPNPVKGDVMMVKNLKNNSNYEILDFSGKLVQKGKLTNDTIHVNGLPKGNYILKIEQVSKIFIKE
ncbi:zinc-dependent metalloprotease [Cloacibacterium caeni]|uniref:zinc-dependent metalloprotease n=1 Tax=Cloacibacterium caeni TaxID=2004710 RepID=UPI001BCECC75|nr:zinc-dependent metalloprotease [Cloacibacterium caeni]